MEGEKRLPFVCTVVLSYGLIDDTIQSLNSLQSLIAIQQQIIVVQNGALEDELNKIETLFPGIHIIRNGKNIGGAAGRNLGIRCAITYNPDYLFFLDNDATVASTALQELILVSEENPQAGFLGCIVYCKSEPKKIMSAGAFIERSLVDVHILQVDRKLKFFEVDYIPSCSMLVPIKTIALTGELDSRLFVYDEDLDWCLRGRKSGLKTLVVTKAAAYHKDTQQKIKHPMRIYYGMRNRLTVAKRRGLFLSIWEKNVLHYLFSASFKTLRSNSETSFMVFIAIWTGFFHFLKGRLGKGPHFLDRPAEAFSEVRVRRKLMKTPLYSALRYLKHLLLMH